MKCNRTDILCIILYMNSLYQNFSSSVQEIYFITPAGVFYRNVLIYKRFDVKKNNYIYTLLMKLYWLLDGGDWKLLELL